MVKWTAARSTFSCNVSSSILFGCSTADFGGSVRMNSDSSTFPSDENWELRIEHWSDRIHLTNAQFSIPNSHPRENPCGSFSFSRLRLALHRLAKFGHSHREFVRSHRLCEVLVVAGSQRL